MLQVSSSENKNKSQVAQINYMFAISPETLHSGEKRKKKLIFHTDDHTTAYSNSLICSTLKHVLSLKVSWRLNAQITCHWKLMHTYQT